MANAALDAVMTAASGGVDAAKIAVLAVLGAFVAFAAAYFGTRKVLALLGYNVPPLWPSDDDVSGTFSDDVRDQEFSFHVEAVKRESRVDGWSSASGTRPADFDRWVN
jgi:hypothetical protein